MTPSVFILGAGRVGRGLTRALGSAGCHVLGLHGRKAMTGADHVSSGELPRVIADAEVIIVAVRDSQLDAAFAELAEATLAPGAVVLHTSGSVDPVEGLKVLRERGHPAGTFHPLAPLSDPAYAPERLRGGWIGTDGDPEAVAMAKTIATRVGARVLRIPEGEKGRYHVAAVFASNFPVVLAAIAVRQFVIAGVAPAAAHAAALSLLSATVENLREHLLPASLTGPVVRADLDTLSRHLDVLAEDPDALAAYRSLSRLAAGVAAEVAGAPAPSKALLALLADPVAS